ncbi:nuclear transport factor 2 family protein [Streptomyces longwoodensis]|uniref:nuclear transport factor 2 family protein n=1 Tax=Streptomyces longwoodensis TaxID=68231 RepID=UPI00384AE08D
MNAEDESQASIVAQIVLRERQSRDRGWWEQMAETYWADSRVRLSWYDGDGPGFVSGSRAMTESGLVTTHQMFAPVVHVRADKAYVEAPTAIRSVTVADGVRGELVVCSRLNYRLQRRQGQWRILSLDPVYESTTLTACVPAEQINVSADELAGFRSSYAILAWDIARRGGTMSADLLGDDEPASVAAFYSSVWKWLQSS